MVDARITSFSTDAVKVVSFLQIEFSKLQTGRANASMVDHIDVEAYGQKMDMRSVAGISIQDAKTIVIQPWDPSVLQAVEKAIQASNLGLNPMNDGSIIRLNLPPMTEERRKELTKVVHKLAEEARISVRQLRQKAHDAIKEDPNETLRESLTGALQKEVDKVNEQIDDLKKKKEEEVMTI